MKQVTKIFSAAITFCILAILFSPGAVAEAASTVPFSLVYECEDLLESVPSSAVASVVENEDASGGKYLHIKGTNTGAKGTADVGTVDAYTPKAGAYEIRVSHTFEKTRTVYVWLRSRYSGTGTYAVYYSVNGGSYTRKNISGANGFSWTRLSTQTILAGDTLTLDFYHRNMNEYFDKIIITDDATFVPESKEDTPYVPDAPVIFECEDLLESVPASAVASVVEDQNASGGKYLKIKGGATQSSAPTAGTYEIRVSHTFDKVKNVYIWLRSRYSGTSTYAVYYSINGSSYTRKNISGANGFSWTCLSTQAVNAGDTLTVDLYHRNMNEYFDKIIITDDYTFSPEGKDALPEYEEEDYAAFGITPNSGHPRIYVTQDTLPALQEKVTGELYASHVSKMESKGTSVTAASYDRSGVMNGALESLSESLRARAFLYLAGLKDEEYARETIDRAITYARTMTYNTNSSSVARSLGSGIWSLALVYDWHYDLLTHEEKNFLIGRMMYLCSYLECGYPIDYRVTFGHGCEYMVYRDIMAAGAAIYDESKTMWANADAWFAQSAAYRRSITPSGNYPEGSFYGNIRTTSEYYAMFLLKPWGIADSQLFGDLFDEKMLKYLYLRMPAGELLFDGELNYRVDMNYYYVTWDSALFNTLLYPESDYYESMLGEFLRSQVTWPVNYSFWLLLFADLESIHTTQAEFDTLPLSWMGSYPFTHVIARTSWAMGMESPLAISFVKGREVAAEYHMKPDNGSFQIYYKGILAANSQGSNNGFLVDAADRNYSRRTIAANCITVTDPDEIFFYNYSASSDWTVLQNDGGQSIDFYRTTRDQSTLQELVDTTGLLAQTQGKYNGPNVNTPIFTYLKSDLTGSYAGTRVHKESGDTLQEVLAEKGYTQLVPESQSTAGTVIAAEDIEDSYFTDFEVLPKLDSYKRSTVFINTNNADYPAAFICYDYVNARQASFEKKWLIHGLDDMTVQDNVITIVNDSAFYNGKLVNVTMLPENVDIQLIGGESMEAYFNGSNYYGQRSYDYYLYKSKWRAEVSPSTEQDTDLFLNAMYVTDADGNLPQLPMYQETTDEFVGVTVLDHVVMFAKDGVPVDTGFAITVRNNSQGQTMHCLITDVAAGVWTVTGGSTTQNIEVAAEENALYFEGLPGTYTIAPAAVGVTADTTSYPQLEGIWELGDFNIFDNTEGNGYLRYNEYPTMEVGGVAYVEAEGFYEYFGVQVTANQDGSYTIQAPDGKNVVVVPGSTACVMNGQAATLTAAPFMENGRLYVAPGELTAATYISCVYYDQYYTLKVTNSYSGE